MCNSRCGEGGQLRVALEAFGIQRIDYQTAMTVVVEKHYLHRKAPCSHAFGLFCNNELKGVICYGTPSSHHLRVGIAGVANAKNVLELTRLWICQTVPRNGESYLIGRTLPLLDKEIIVSYAEPSMGHIGVVYQASNWLYTGLSARRTHWVVEGLAQHSQTLSDKYSAKELREKYGKAFKLVQRPRKHRYVYLRGNRRRKKELQAQLKYPILPYPKQGGVSNVK